jgi:hypothetical protein
LPAIKKAAKTGGKIAQRARLELESKTGRKVVTGENYLPPSKSKKGLREDCALSASSGQAVQRNSQVSNARPGAPG